MRTFLIVAISLFFASWAGAQNDTIIPLYLEPQRSGNPYFREPLSKIEQLQAKPVFDAPGGRTSGWFVVELPGSFTGHVKATQVDGAGVKKGTNVHVRPDSKSAVMTTLGEAADVRIGSRNGEWVSVNYSGKARAFFQQSDVAGTTGPAAGSLTSAPPARSVSAPPPSPAPTTQAAPPPQPQKPRPTRSRFLDTSAGTSVTRQAAPPPQSAPPASRAPSPSPAALPSVRRTPQAAPVRQPAANPQPAPAEIQATPPDQPLGKKISRQLEGRFVRRTGLDNLFGPSFEYELRNADGKRLAYLDLSEALIYEPMNAYFDEFVEVEGNLASTSNGLVMKARSLRLR